MTQPPQDPWQHGHRQAPGPGGPYQRQHPPQPHPHQPHPHQFPPPQAYPPQAQWAPPKKSNGPLIAACVSAVALLVVGVIVVVSLTGGESEVADAGYRAGPGATAAPGTSETTSERPPPGSRTPSSTPSRERSSTANAPRSQQKVLKLADHPILADAEAGLQNLACSLPAWRSDQGSAEAFFTAAGTCLDAAWGPFLEAYDLPFSPPALHFPTGSNFQTDCGTIEVGIATAAYYCENNLYVPFAGLQTEQYGNNPGVYLSLFAHEYGHHVQEVAGLMDAAWEAIYQVGQDTEAGMEMARRKELQAQCFSGMFLGAHVDRGGTIDRDMYNKAWDDQETRGDNTSGSRDHGTNAHYAQWWRAGAKDNRIVDCNTFAAPAAEVA
ncbi:metalloprotease [Amycolatopsis antarctica]|uniref:Metalloprotease n=1 Tax=Amycolatopsis antarctica TaxID=1854586 RepID=A0A263D9H8_9PSEU|nr:neutral zinc metallopeptidase [Amycolatopsis antarctica]OZM75182.1 metalloprotease [Amycolatopsis antarctica]